MSVAPTLEGIHEVVLARRYDAALEALRQRLRDDVHTLTDPQLWGRLVNAHEWFETVEEPEQYFNYVTALITSVADRVDELMDTDAGPALATAFITGVQFRLTAHSSGDPRPIALGRARLFQARLTKFSVPLTHSFATAVSGSKPRLGVLFKHLVQDPETNSVLPFFAEARAKGIEVLLFVASDRVDQAFLKFIQPMCDNIYRLSDDLSQAVLQLRGADIDILLFGNDITAKPGFFAHLSFYRLARLGATCVSSLVTTASPAIDVYFGCPYYVESGFARHFFERFVAAPNPSFAFSYPSRQPEAETLITRANMGVSPDTPLFVSGANQSKLHKGMLGVWAEILRRCPDARLLLYPFPPHFGGTRQDVTNRVLSQFIAMGIDQGRILVAQSIPSRDAVIGMLRHCDVGLDSFPYTGVTTVVDAIEAGLPTVSLKGGALRSSQGAAVLHTADFDELVAHSIDDYVDLAVNLMQDASRRINLRARVAEAARRTPAFLRAKEFSDAVADIYHKLHGELAAGQIPQRGIRL
ncbi:MAG: hypothetical protein K2P94_10990 [Rhodospirillaceae bacterium]|nr:hypothetical protein [Rhodospirillaceae bacterium]